MVSVGVSVFLCIFLRLTLLVGITLFLKCSKPGGDSVQLSSAEILKQELLNVSKPRVGGGPWMKLNLLISLSVLLLPTSLSDLCNLDAGSITSISSTTGSFPLSIPVDCITIFSPLYETIWLRGLI